MTLTLVGALATGIPISFGAGTLVPRAAADGYASEPFDIRPGIDPWAIIRSPDQPLRSADDPIGYFDYRGRTWDHPSRQAEDGLHFLTKFDRNGDARLLRAAETVGDHLLSYSATIDGSLHLQYPFDWDGAAAPWHSALSQGRALSLFSRLADRAGERWRPVADAVYRSFLRPPDRSPWYVLVDDRGSLWLEEAPDDTRPGLIVNGHIAASWGLMDYWLLTGDDSARQLVDGALTTVKDRWGDIRIVGDFSRYGLVDLRQDDRYHATHIKQLRALAALTGDDAFGGMADELAFDSGVLPIRRALAPLVGLWPLAAVLLLLRSAPALMGRLRAQRSLS